ncbi:hypothetical protein ACLIN3_27435 (plasmid) [Pseudomonas orientalis]|uniref:hypothetical protein n=1 Tax=Pseudomonas orientalis TaxID=76758 RepID=UPI003985AC52
MKRWDVYQDGKWVEGVQARNHSEAVFEAMHKLDLDDEAVLEALRKLNHNDESGLDVRLAAQ